MCPLKERLSITFQPLIGLCFVLSELARHLVKIKLSIKCIHVYRWEKPWLKNLYLVTDSVKYVEHTRSRS